MSERASKWLTFAGLAVIALLFAPPALILVQAYSDMTVEINKQTYCYADGLCQPEMYVTRTSSSDVGYVRVNYTPSVDPHVWNITLRNISSLVVDAETNYIVRTCSTFFASCPDTEYPLWLVSQPGNMTVWLDIDAPLSFRLRNVPVPVSAELDDVAFDNWSATWDGVSAWGIMAGVRKLEFAFAYNPVVPRNWALVMTAFVIFVTLAAIGLAGRTGVPLILSGLLGICIGSTLLVWGGGLLVMGVGGVIAAISIAFILLGALSVAGGEA